MIITIDSGIASLMPADVRADLIRWSMEHIGEVPPEATIDTDGDVTFHVYSFRQDGTPHQLGGSMGRCHLAVKGLGLTPQARRFATAAVAATLPEAATR